jgi:hypothetical protein
MATISHRSRRTPGKTGPSMFGILYILGTSRLDPHDSEAVAGEARCRSQRLSALPHFRPMCTDRSNPFGPRIPLISPNHRFHVNQRGDTRPPPNLSLRRCSTSALIPAPMLESPGLCRSKETAIQFILPTGYGSAISRIPTAPIGFTSIVVCFLLVPCRTSQEANLANFLGFYLAIWLMRLRFLSPILFS